MSSPSREELVERICGLLRDEILASNAHCTPQTNLVEAGLDSLAVTQLMLSIEEQFGVWVDESLLTQENLETAETLGGLIHSQLRDS